MALTLFVYVRCNLIPDFKLYINNPGNVTVQQLYLFIHQRLHDHGVTHVPIVDIYTNYMMAGTEQLLTLFVRPSPHSTLLQPLFAPYLDLASLQTMYHLPNEFTLWVCLQRRSYRSINYF